MTKPVDGTDLSDFKHTEGEKGQSALDRYASVKIGFLGAKFSPAYRNIHQMAFDIAKEEGWLPRNVEMIARQEGGLPQGSAENVVKGYMTWLSKAAFPSPAPTAPTMRWCSRRSPRKSRFRS